MAEEQAGVVLFSKALMAGSPAIVISLGGLYEVFARLCFVNFSRHVAFDSIQLLAPEKSERLRGKTQLQRLVQKVKL